MSQMEFLLSYFIHTRTKLENDIKILQNNVLRRRVDEVDCVELMLALERLHCFNEFADTVCGIFRLKIIDE